MDLKLVRYILTWSQRKVCSFFFPCCWFCRLSLICIHPLFSPCNRTYVWLSIRSLAVDILIVGYEFSSMKICNLLTQWPWFLGQTVRMVCRAAEQGGSPSLLNWVAGAHILIHWSCCIRRIRTQKVKVPKAILRSLLPTGGEGSPVQNNWGDKFQQPRRLQVSATAQHIIGYLPSLKPPLWPANTE